MVVDTALEALARLIQKNARLFDTTVQLLGAVYQVSVMLFTPTCLLAV